MISIKATFVLAKALLTGETVSEETLRARLVICADCSKVHSNKRGELRCSICRCRLKGDRSLINLARYVETSEYGCKFKSGSKWAAAGLSK